ncbi:glucose-6-phosphate dehydrogenase [Buchnera aphidicola]|uniref:glucose-6-phosphate dehydrogenase n=1 Tax=Buchnera aphidicola TaxID=9 RepID=UPI0030D625FE
MVFSKKIKECDLVIFGTKGDLSKRKLFPALYQLEESLKLYKNTKIIGVGRADWTQEYYKKIIKKYIKKFSYRKFKKKIWKKFSNRLYFCNIDVNKFSNFLKLKKIFKKEKKIKIYYFAIPQNTFKNIFKGLKKINYNYIQDRIILEKPIGNSLETSKKINNQVGKYFQEKQIFRIDHYLGKETILNLLSLKFSNSIFFTNWNKSTIDHIQITVAEKIGIEGRWNYFDKIGQMRDMIQNHLLQILCILTMSPPINLQSNSIRDEKLKILKSLRMINEKNVNKNTVRGQYKSGFFKNKNIPGYIDEINSIKNSNTETFVSIKVNIDNSQWHGVPFYLRTGKRLPLKHSEIVIYFKKNDFNLFNNFKKKLPLNKIVIRLEPNEGIDIFILNKIPKLDSKYELKEIKLNFDYKKTFNKCTLYNAYERLLLESFLGSQSLFVRRDEIEESWKWIDSIINAWNKKKSKLELYTAGTWGPKSSNTLLKKDGRFWNKIK